MDINFRFENESFGYDEYDRRKNNVIYALTYIPILFWLPFVIDSVKGSELGKFHANQSLNVLIIGALSGVVVGIIYAFGFVPFLGWIFLLIGSLVRILLGLAVGGLALTGIISSAQGNVIKMPVVGDIILIK
ncbi:MAG: hypothetical protein LBL93_02695 [Ruminococcus sp.]|jgi:uncharacterized membrane protein|nr:hypothetical protein [Ruminococcus sp.]